NDIPHIAYTEVTRDRGVYYWGVFYNNRISGSWNASGVEVEGFSSSQACRQPDIAIDSDDKPCISYWNLEGGTYGTVRAAIGNVNNAASFTLFTIASAGGGYVIDHRYTGIAVDSNGDHHVAYAKIASAGIADSLEIRKHVKANAWSSWETVEVVDDSPGLEPFYVTLAINGTDRYIFCGEVVTDDVVYYIDTGSGWGSQQTLETGTYKAVRVKWAYNVNRGSDGTDYGGGSGIPELDYVFEDSTATPDIFYNKVVLAVLITVDADIIFPAITISAQAHLQAEIDMVLPVLTVESFAGALADITLPQITVNATSLIYGDIDITLPLLTVLSSVSGEVDAVITLPLLSIQGLGRPPPLQYYITVPNRKRSSD
ncbi:hypothetical protein LCGC14_2855910, partial [marine sediment metagenome]